MVLWNLTHFGLYFGFSAFTFQDDSMDQLDEHLEEGSIFEGSSRVNADSEDFMDEHLEEGSIFEGPSRVNVDSEDLINETTDSVADKDCITEDSCSSDVYIVVENSRTDPLSEGCVALGVSMSKEDSVSLKETEKSDAIKDPSVSKMDPSDIDSDMDPAFRINSSDSGHTGGISTVRMTEIDDK